MLEQQTFTSEQLNTESILLDWLTYIDNNDSEFLEHYAPHTTRLSSAYLPKLKGAHVEDDVMDSANFAEQWLAECLRFEPGADTELRRSAFQRGWFNLLRNLGGVM